MDDVVVQHHRKDMLSETYGNGNIKMEDRDMTKNEIVENRLKSLKGAYDRIEAFMDEAGSVFPKEATDVVKKYILGDEELKRFMNGLESHRTPRIMMLGRTGIGKSSLINAICGGYVAEVSDVKSCTSETRFYTCHDDGRVLMDIMDSRGFSENKALKDSSAEEELLRDIVDFAPDAILMVLSCDRRDSSITEDLDFLMKARKVYFEEYCQDVPIIAVINRADTVAPKREQSPLNYSDKKKKNIDSVVEEYKKTFKRRKVRFNEIIAVSSLIDWKIDDGSEDGRPVTVEEIESLTDSEKRHISIEFDGRYQIEELRDIIESSMESFEASMGFMMAVKLDELVMKLARKTTNIFATISGTVAASPIPIADVYILISLQSMLVALIARLAGREIGIEGAKEFVLSLGGVTVAGFGLRTLAQQCVKAANLLFPGAGSIISTGIASSGTKMIGELAMKYYLSDGSFEEIKREMKERRKEA